MGFQGLARLLPELERAGHLKRISQEIDPNLEMAEIQRRAYLAGAPALLFENVIGSDFPALGNLYGTLERCHFMFRKTIDRVKKAVSAKADPPALVKEALRTAWKQPLQWLGMPLTGIHALPKKISPSRAPVLACKTTLDRLPQIKSWPMDGGPFVTLPQVFSRDPNNPSLMKANLGMYRVQIAGNEYALDEVGIHYQIHRGIGIHHTEALKRGEPLKVSIFVGGNPADSFAAVMPLPEGLSELMFAGMLGGNRFRYAEVDGHIVSADADFCIVGTISGETKPEGPFGDHLGYYSLVHPFPVMKVDAVYHRKDAIWPFTVVGRPPQEDTSFGKMIHEITVPMVPVSLPGVQALHAVDAAGVHPLLLVLGSERYVPYEERKPQEILTQANAVLGFNQCSLAKYLFIAASNDDPNLDIDDIPAFMKHLLERVDWRRDLHFQTSTTIDTLDYSGTGLNQGSKLVIAAAGKPVRNLTDTVPEKLTLPGDWTDPHMALPGIMTVSAPKFETYDTEPRRMEDWIAALAADGLEGVAVITVVDDSAFAAKTLNNWLWNTFTLSNPSHDVYGLGASIQFKHWSCQGPLVIDARLKPHNAPPLLEDEAVTARVDAMCDPGNCLHGIF
ncbi:MAG: UbiD family decarboxylase [Acidobacteriota bacterium]|nr:UbiD family decarboxylase [Acidobacteriota bacterium]